MIRSIRPAIVAFAVLALVAWGCGGSKLAESPQAQGQAQAPVAASGAQEIHLAVTDAGFEPAQVTVAKDRPIVLTVVRKTDQTCAREIVFKEIDLKRDLPLNQEVRIELPARTAGTPN